MINDRRREASICFGVIFLASLRTTKLVDATPKNSSEIGWLKGDYDRAAHITITD